jgi:glutamate formiminotransferase/formiminotetrahydrofolate cyclodeaminase
MGKAGATVIGARAALIAFNVYLTTDDVSVAKAIAKTIRFSSGGLRFVKAMGVEVEGRAQVSMNLTNFKKTPISLVVETIRREAARFGVAIHHSELVGLVPQEALLDAALWYTQLDQFESGQVLENQLTMAVEAKAGPYSFLDDLASPQPTPGGGSAAAFSAAEAAALVAMVAGVTLGKKKYEAVGASMQALMQSAEGLRQRLTRAIESDAASFSALMAAFRLPKETPEEKSSRAEAVVQGSLHAARVPLQTSGMALEALNYALEAAEKGNINAITDAATAGALCLAAISAAGANVRVNLSALKGNPQAEEMLAEASRLENEAQGHYAQLKKILKTRAEIDLA